MLTNRLFVYSSIHLFIHSSIFFCFSCEKPSVTPIPTFLQMPLSCIHDNIRPGMMPVV